MTFPSRRLAHVTNTLSIQRLTVSRQRNMTCGLRPSSREATAVARQWLDWMPPRVMVESQPVCNASASRNSSLRTFREHRQGSSYVSIDDKLTPVSEDSWTSWTVGPPLYKRGPLNPAPKPNLRYIPNTKRGPIVQGVQSFYDAVFGEGRRPRTLFPLNEAPVMSSLLIET